MSDEAFVDLKQALEDAFAYGERVYQNFSGVEKRKPVSMQELIFGHGKRRLNVCH